MCPRHLLLFYSRLRNESIPGPLIYLNGDFRDRLVSKDGISPFPLSLSPLSSFLPPSPSVSDATDEASERGRSLGQVENLSRPSHSGRSARVVTFFSPQHRS